MNVEQFFGNELVEKNKVEETVHELTRLSDRIDLAMNYLSCLSLQLKEGENALVIWSLTAEKGLANLMSNLEVVSEDLVKVANSLEVSE